MRLPENELNSMSTPGTKRPRHCRGLFIKTTKIMTDQKFTLTKDGKTEEVALEKWGWGVVYKDGRELHQFGSKGDFHQIAEIEQDNVRLFVLYQTGDMSKRIDIALPEGAKIIHKYRNFVLNLGTEGERHVRVYIFGYKKSASVAHYNFILPDGRIIQSDTDAIQLTDFNL